MPRTRGLGALLVAGVIGTAALATSCGAGGDGGRVADPSAAATAELVSSAPVEAAGRLLLALPDGGVEAHALGSPGAAHEMLSADLFERSYGRSEMRIAYDAASGLLWYSTSHDTIRSLHLADGEPGPALGGFGDVAIVGCSVGGEGRRFAVDAARRLLLVPQLTGALIIHDADTLKLVGAFGPGFFGDVGYAEYRSIVVDPARGTYWYATVVGDLVEFDPDRGERTGRVIAADAQLDLPPTTDREIFVDAGRDQLVYADAGGILHAIDLEGLAPVERAFPSRASAAVSYAP